MIVENKNNSPLDCCFYFLQFKIPRASPHCGLLLPPLLGADRP